VIVGVVQISAKTAMTGGFVSPPSILAFQRAPLENTESILQLLENVSVVPKEDGLPKLALLPILNVKHVRLGNGPIKLI